MGDRDKTADLSRRDQGYPDVPLEQTRERWMPDPPAGVDRSAPGSGLGVSTAAVGIAVALLLVILLVALVYLRG